MPSPARCVPLLLTYSLVLALIFARLSAEAAVTVSLGQNFIGSTYGDISQDVPPDANGAIGPGFFMEFINGTVAVYNKTNGLSVQRKSDLEFWTDAGLIIAANTATTDPRVIYDPTVQRWFAVQVDFNATASDPTLVANKFLFAVTTTADPTTGWIGFKFQADPSTGNFADFPTLGVDGNAVYISGDFFHANVPIGPGLVSIPKADLIASTPTIANRHWFGVMSYATRGQVLQPAICFDGSSSGQVLAMGDIGNDSDPHSNVVSFAVQNAGGASPTLSASTSISVSPYVVPFNNNMGVPLFAAVQPDGSATLQANDARLSAKVYAVNGVLYAVHNTEVNNRIAIRWYRINAANHTLLESGTIVDASLDLFFPSIAANANGVVVIGCNGSSASTFVSSFAYVGETVNGATSFGSRVLLRTGANNYHDANEILAQLLGDPVVDSRWGDYSAMSVDPNDPTRFWTIQTYPSGLDPGGSGVGIWSTQITELITTQTGTIPPPQLTIAPAGTNVLVSWSSSASSFQLQTTTNLPASSWALASQTRSTNGGLISMLIPKSASRQFFRLLGP